MEHSRLVLYHRLPEVRPQSCNEIATTLLSNAAASIAPERPGYCANDRALCSSTRNDHSRDREMCKGAE